jgi:hypothetical protein
MGSLSVMYSDEKVTLPDGAVLHVRPLPLKHLPRVLRSIIGLAQQLEEGKSITELLVSVGDDVIELMSFCLQSDAGPVDYENLPSAIAPRVLEIMIDQNLPAETTKNWSSLLGKLAKIIPTGVPSSPVISPKTLRGLKKK